MDRARASSRAVRARSAARARCGVLLLALVTGCGGGGTTGGSNTDRLTEDDARSALLSETNLGDQYVAATEDGPVEDGSLGCLNALDGRQTPGAPTEIDRIYEFVNELGLPAIRSQVSSYDKVGDATDAFDALRAALESCTTVEETDDDGTRTKLTVTTEVGSPAAGADDQITVVATGTENREGMKLPFGLVFSAARVENHVTSVGIVDLGEGVGAMIDSYVEVAVDRLDAVASGDEPEEVPVDLTAGAAGSGGPG